MRLYHHPFSANTRRVLVTARQVGVALEIVEVDFSTREQLSDAFLSLNPAHRVPVLVDGDFVLSESHAIMQYLADVAGDAALYPTERRARSGVEKWLFWCAQHFQTPASALNVERFVKPMMGWGPVDPAHVERSEREFVDSASVLDAQLARTRYLCGDRPTLADLAVAPVLTYARTASLPLADRPNIRRWFAEIEAMPCWRGPGDPPEATGAPGDEGEGR